MARRAANRDSRSGSDIRRSADIVASKLRLFGIAVLCAKVALVPLVFDPAADYPFTVPKALLSHGLSYVLVGVAAGLVIQFGRSFLVWSWIHAPVLAFLAVSTLAAAFAPDRTLALFGTHARMLGLGTIADGVVFYFSVVLLVRSRIDARVIVASALAAAIPVLGYEALQLTGKDPLIWDTDGALNPFSTIGQPTTLGLYLTVVAVGAFSLGALLPDLRGIGRVAAVVYSGLLLVGAGATGTRSVLLGVAAGAVVIVLAIWARQSARPRRLALVVGGAGVAVALVALISVTPSGSRIAATIQQLTGGPSGADRVDESTVTRLALYRIAADELVERPFLGYGPDNFVVGVPKYRPELAPASLRQSLATSAHSWVAEVATSSGLLGFGCFLAMLILAFVSTVRQVAHPLAAVSAASLAAFLGAGLTTVNDVATQPLLWLSLGGVAAATVRSRTTDEQPTTRSTRRPNPPRPAGLRASDIVALGLTAVGLGLSLSTMTALGASRSNDLSQAARVPGQAPRAIELAATATRADPARADYWQGLGLAYVAASRWRDAAAAFDHAGVLAPYDVRYKNDQVAALISLGDGEARARAVQVAEQSVSTDPNNPLAQLTRANVMQVSANLPEALRSVERALALDPQSNNDRLYITATQIYLDSGHPTDAITVARQGLAIIDRLEISVRSFPIRFELARALATAGQTQEALDEVDLILRNRPNYPGAERLRTEIRARL